MLSLKNSSVFSFLFFLAIGSQTSYGNEKDDREFDDTAHWASNNRAGFCLNGGSGPHSDWTSVKLREIIARDSFEIVRSDGKFNPLHIAALQGLDEIAELLLQKGMNPFVQDHAGKIPLEIALHFTGRGFMYESGNYGGATQVLRDKMLSILSEGNPGTLSVLRQIFYHENKNGIELVKVLYRKDMKGIKLWDLYKNEAGSNVNRLMELVTSPSENQDESKE